ncbi:hypothetical protein ACSBR1_017796 [Camellia fascicularis]
MKFIKNRLRNRMGDQWLNDCLVTYIEKYVFDSVDNELIIFKPLHATPNPILFSYNLFSSSVSISVVRHFSISLDSCFLLCSWIRIPFLMLFLALSSSFIVRSYTAVLHFVVVTLILDLSDKTLAFAAGRPLPKP